MVKYFAAPDAAERAGFRPCLRCKPGQSDPVLDLVRRACGLLDAHPELNVEALAELVGVRPRQLLRAFQSRLGLGPKQYADARRLACFKSQVRQGRGVAEAMYEAGYGSSSRLYERAPEQLGMTPATYRRGGRGACIGWATAPCALGRVLVAATERGICAVYLGDSEESLAATLAREYPDSEIRRDEADVGAWIEAIAAHLDGRLPALDLPLDVRATAFQRRVWEALRSIPYGATRSYGEIAAAVGQPGAARAVARACATNEAALVIPCHRVVRGDGAPGGYRWGEKRKQALLEREAACSRKD
jgi:AraC family transcriptional regulator of adaptative response/methylated-DNA-[protein]-cysteine methyltransferase